ncbi:hypothetical protein IU459_27095 [Nocardia amamiensis]|uniref:Uncharacterized protein n=1 Tax=Nocardia amamiensis TaxID=404578 RepID=A0ABS0D264_9NOCA|nr:hypothetical protein [Nocardia amamiensis]MBF6301183.1 hypothetical protein [Nocardia amamiensis]
MSPMRLRVLELPTRTLGAASETPFVLVIDRCAPVDAEVLAYQAHGIRATTGAAGVLVFVDEVDLDAAAEWDEATARQALGSLAHLLDASEPVTHRADEDRPPCVGDTHHIVGSRCACGMAGAGGARAGRA